MEMHRRLIAACIAVLALIGVGAWWLQASGGRDEASELLSEALEARHGAALRALDVRSLATDPRSGDVVVVFGTGRRREPLTRRLEGLAGAGGCGELRVGLDVGSRISAWGDASGRHFHERFDCVVEELSGRLADLRRQD